MRETSGANQQSGRAFKIGTAVFPDILECPETRLALRLDGDDLVVVGSDKRYSITDGIPNLSVPTLPTLETTDVTDIVKAFYEETPFPNYDELDSRESLQQKARRGFMAAMLDRQLPKSATILEAGCGTGQLSNFLGMSGRRTVIGGDICMNSLRLAKGFRDRYSIGNSHFIQMNLFRPPFRDESFDFIISNGVLHHTADPVGGFAALVRKLKPGGKVIIGLYNSYARLPTLWRRRLFQMFGKSLYFLDSRLRSTQLNPARSRAWLMDQYYHPHESRHSMDEILEWFGSNSVEFLSGVPHPDGRGVSAGEDLFGAQSPGSRLSRATTQLGMLLSGGADGGLFIMIGRKRG